MVCTLLPTVLATYAAFALVSPAPSVAYYDADLHSCLAGGVVVCVFCCAV